MRRTVWTVVSLMALAGCGGGSDAVGENSPESIKTTAMGNVVATMPSPTPTPTADAAMMSNATDANAIDSLSDNIM